MSSFTAYVGSAGYEAREKLNKHQRKALDQDLRNTPPDDVVAIDALLEQGADPNTPHHGKSNSPLYAAAAAGEVQTIDLLLSRGALVDANGGPYHTALKGAILADQYDAAVTLIERGANINHRDGFADITPLGLAIGDRHVDLVAMLLQYGADPNAHCAPMTSPVALIENMLMCSHTSQKPSCKKCAHAAEYQQMLAMLKEHGGKNSSKAVGEKAAHFLADVWSESPSVYDSDQEVKKAMKGLEKAKQRKKDREEKVRHEASAEGRLRQGMVAESRRQFSMGLL